MSQPNWPGTLAPIASTEQSVSGEQNSLNNPPRPAKARSISFAGPSTSTEPRPDRRKSIQLPSKIEETTKSSDSLIKETSSPILPALPGRLRNRSPPPPRTYQPRVSFDTFSNYSVPDQEFTLVSKHNGYTYCRHQRVFLVAVDQNSYSEHALKWVIENMIEDGDEIICLRVVEPDPKTKEGATAAQIATYRDDAKELLTQIQDQNEATEKKAISIIMEFAVGSVEQTILHMIHIYSPAFLTVGTRGKSLGGLQGLLPGSVSKWCVQNSPVPVVVVRHPEKRKKKMMKRQSDQNRQSYTKIQEKSASRLGNKSKIAIDGGKPIETEAGEAEAVAIAVAKGVSASDKRASRKGKEVERNDNTSANSRGRQSSTSLPETVERGGLNDEFEEAEEEAEEDVEGLESDEESEDSDEESPEGATYVENIGIEQMPNYVAEPDSGLDNDVEGLNLDDGKDRPSTS